MPQPFLTTCDPTPTLLGGTDPAALALSAPSNPCLGANTDCSPALGVPTELPCGDRATGNPWWEVKDLKIKQCGRSEGRQLWVQVDVSAFPAQRHRLLPALPDLSVATFVLADVTEADGPMGTHGEQVGLEGVAKDL